MDQVTAGYTVLGLVLYALGVILAVLWILVPFAVFGIKGLLKRQIEEQRRTNELLAAAAQRQQLYHDAYLNARVVVGERAQVPPPPL